MIIGIPREIKTHEYRVALLPVGAKCLTQDGHRVFVQKGAGLGAGISDMDYENAGAEILDSMEEIYDEADLILKVKEPQPSEIKLLQKGQTLFCFFHFAASKTLTESCLSKKITAIAYETLFDQHGRLPLLAPMSEIAGKLAAQEGAKCLENPMQGRGILLGGVAGVERANVLILGGGIVGAGAAKVAAGLGANVVIMDVNQERMRYLEDTLPANVKTVFSDPHAVETYAQAADLIIGAVLIPGKKAPHLLAREQLKLLKPGTVLVDVSIDQGGVFETSRPTTHDEPTFVIDGIVHYCVANMPGAVSRTSTFALCNATLPYARCLANLGTEKFIAQGSGHQEALNMRNGVLTNRAVAEAFPNLPYQSPV
ncbi:alanine dehydrogenase [Chloroherpeton thalassium ATCC 35110]|uniref:Alanine dehydrogenase n=1 Tax=Chloroherpeton thalassium (strain ATCC 35110 / GB-78) TaxID=517418 RepID=B3QT51_CHLT3|nr:alanine dehydrogenase [Chloroherpeton thalassium]ACF14150.1 alanine dehydrogenase [Chloroherpeton thalassium ATCC 35110]